MVSGSLRTITFAITPRHLPRRPEKCLTASSFLRTQLLYFLKGISRSVQMQRERTAPCLSMFHSQMNTTTSSSIHPLASTAIKALIEDILHTFAMGSADLPAKGHQFSDSASAYQWFEQSAFFQELAVVDTQKEGKCLLGVFSCMHYGHGKNIPKHTRVTEQKQIYSKMDGVDEKEQALRQQQRLVCGLADQVRRYLSVSSSAKCILSWAASWSVWEDVECKLWCVNYRRVLDPRREYWLGYKVTVISNDWCKSTMGAWVISLGIFQSVRENIIWTVQPMAGPVPSLVAPVPSMRAPATYLGVPVKSLGVPVPRLKVPTTYLGAPVTSLWTPCFRVEQVRKNIIFKNPACVPGNCRYY